MSRLMTKQTKWYVRRAKTQFSLGTRPVRSESSLSAWRKIGSLATHWAKAKTLIRLGGCPGWSESSLGAYAILLVLSRGGSNRSSKRGWMDGWVRVLRPFNSISVISRRWKGEHERLCAMKRRLGSGRISPPAGFEPATPRSEVGSANRSATRTLLSSKHNNALRYSILS